MHWRRKWQPTPVFLPGESQGRRGLVGCRLWGHTELDTTEATQQEQQQQQQPEPCNRFSLVIYFMHSINSVYVSISMSRSIRPLLSPSVSRCLFLCLCLYFCFVNKIIYTNFFRFYIYALAYNIYLSPSDLRFCVIFIIGFSGGCSGRESSCQCRRHKRHGFNPWVGKAPWRRAWQPTPVFLPGESHGHSP